MKNDKNLPSNENDIKSYRNQKKKKLIYLEGYKDNYDVDKFISDLLIYFDGEVDFDLEKIREALNEAGKLESLIKKAEKKNTHPVVVFIQELFKDLTAEKS